jgi:chromosome segregation ATPase
MRTFAERPHVRRRRQHTRDREKSSHSKKPSELSADMHCPVHPDGKHTWGECSQNPANKKDDKQNDKKRDRRSNKDDKKAENTELREKNELCEEIFHLNDKLFEEIKRKDEIVRDAENFDEVFLTVVAENTELKKRVVNLKQLFKSQCEKVRDMEKLKKTNETAVVENEELRKKIEELHKEIQRKDLEIKILPSTLKRVTKWTSIETKQITNTLPPEQEPNRGVGTAAMQSISIDEYKKEIGALSVRSKEEKEKLQSRLKSAENEVHELKQIVAQNKEESDSLKKLQKSTLNQLVEKLKVISDLQKVNEKLSKDVERKELTLKQITDLIGGQSTDKEKELESTIAQDRKEIISLKEQLKNSRPIETVDLTNEIERSTSSDEDSHEEVPPSKRRRMESNLAIALEQSQQMVAVKEEAIQRATAAEANAETARQEKHAVEASLRNVEEQSQQIVSIKHEAIQRAVAAEANVEAARREKASVEASLRTVKEQSQQMVKVKEEAIQRAAAAEANAETARLEKDAVEASLRDVQEDLEDVNEVVTQQTLTTDIWQGRFDEVFELAREAGVDGKRLSEIRYRPLSSGS